MDLSKIALLSTSDARKIKWASCGNDAEEVNASPRLLELLEDGYTVYIVSTRPKLSPEKYDKCLFDLIPEENFFTPIPELLDGRCAQDAGYIEMWERVLTHLGIHPGSFDAKHFRYELCWMDLRLVAEEAGITIR